MSVSVENFKVEYENQPVGLATNLPRFSWQIKSSEKTLSKADTELRFMNG